MFYFLQEGCGYSVSGASVPNLVMLMTTFSAVKRRLSSVPKFASLQTGTELLRQRIITPVGFLIKLASLLFNLTYGEPVSSCGKAIAY